MPLTGNELYAFRNFRLNVGERLLLKNDERIRLPEKAFETLCVLVRQNGRLVGKDELLGEVWPDSIVEENNLDKNVSLLRRVLGEGKGKHKFIETVRGHGYRFVPDVKRVKDADDPPVAEARPSPPKGAGSHSDRGTGRLAAVVSLSDWRHETAPVVSEPETAQTSAIVQTSSLKAPHYWLAAIVIICVGVGLLGFYFWRGSTRGSPIRSVAVLPFVNVGADAELEYFSEGLSETLIDRLSELPQLTVIARSSSFKFRDENLDLQDVAHKLGVQAIVTGRVTRRGDDLAVRVELIDVRDNKQVWGEQFKGKASDTLAIEAQMARTVSDELRLKLTGEQAQHLVKGGTSNPQAYELVLKGNYFYRTAGAEKLMKAIESYEQAIALDPNYALAYARIARTYGRLANNSLLDPKDVVSKARAAAQKAVELDENLADGHLALARVAVDDWDWTAAERSYLRAIELNPSHSDAHRFYSSFLSEMGQHNEALIEAKRSSELDPERLTSRVTILSALFKARRFDEMIVESKKILEIDPKHRGALDSIGYAYSYKGMHAQAITYLESVQPARVEVSQQIFLGAAYARAGEKQKAGAIRQRMETTKEYVSPAELAVLYTALGEHEKAFASLEKAYAAHDLQLKYLNADPGYEPLRADSRFKDLVRRVGLPS